MALPTWTINQISNNLSRSNLEWSGSAITYGFPPKRPPGRPGKRALVSRHSMRFKRPQRGWRFFKRYFALAVKLPKLWGRWNL